MRFKRRRSGALAAAAGILALGSWSIGAGSRPPTPAYAATSVNGGGSSFAAPEAQQWTADVARNPYDLSVNYVLSSSGAGRNQYASGNYDYGASDIVYNPEDGQEAQVAASQRPFKYVTVTAGGLAFEYNLVVNGQRFKSLQLTRKDVCQVFTGEITQWNQLYDPVATPGNDALQGFTQRIQVVVRSDSAGESWVLSQYCLSVDHGDWMTFANWVNSNTGSIGYQGDVNLPNDPISYWPPELYHNDTSVLSVSGAPNEAQSSDNPNLNGAIGYVATAYAKQLGATVAAVQNGAGAFTLPDANSVQLALSYARPNSLGTFDLDFTGSNPQAYFPSTYSYVIDPTTSNTPDPAINAPLNAWLCYSIGRGQNEAAPLNYAPLSAQVTALSVAAIEATPGAPPASQCGVGGPAPSVAANGAGISGNNGSSGTKSSSGSGLNSTGAMSASISTSASGTVAAATNPATGAPQSSSGTSAEAGPQGPSNLLSVTSSDSGNSPVSNQALWWVLGGILLTGGATGVVGVTRRDRG